MQKSDFFFNPKNDKKTFKSKNKINENYVSFLRPYEKKRASERIFLVLDANNPAYIKAFYSETPKELFDPDGTFAYVVHTEQTAKERNYPSRYVAWSIPQGTHNKTFHVGLSDFAIEVIAAGEMKFRKGKLVYFDKGSGTYSPTDIIKETSGFPPEKYRALDYDP